MKVFCQNQFATHAHRPIWTWIAALIFTGAMVLACHGAAQTQRQRTNGLPPRPVMPNIDPLDMPPVYQGDPTQGRQNEKRLQYLNAERQRSMVATMNRLVKLAADLNAQINSGDRTQVTPDQLRQLAEIEKLAHNIRDKMSTSVRQSPSLESGPAFLPSHPLR